MRYYEIIITDPTGGAEPIVFTSWFENPPFPSSVFGGRSDLGALNVSFDFQIAPFSNPRGASIIEISGIDLKLISRAFDLNDRNIKISAGFKPGLPLASEAANDIIDEEGFNGLT